MTGTEFMNGLCGCDMTGNEFVNSLCGRDMGPEQFVSITWGKKDSRTAPVAVTWSISFLWMASLALTWLAESRERVVAVAVASGKAVVVAITSGEVCEAHKMAAAITGSTVDRGVISGNTGLGHGTTRLEQVTACTDFKCGSMAVN